MADFKDDDFYIVHYLDDTKKMVFNAAGLAAGQVATLNIPDPGAGVSYAGTLALTNIANTFVTGQRVDNLLGGNASLEIARNGTGRIELVADSSSGRLDFLTGGMIIFFDAASSNSVNLTGPTAPTANNLCTLPDATTELAGWSAPGIIDAAWEFDCVSAVPLFHTDNSGGAATNAAFEILDDTAGWKASIYPSVAWSADVAFTLPAAGGQLVAGSGLTSGRVALCTTGGVLTSDADLTFSGSTLTATNLVITTALTTIGGTAPVANGTYIVGARLTPGGVDGTITTKSGIITAVTQAT